MSFLSLYQSINLAPGFGLLYLPDPPLRLVALQRGHACGMELPETTWTPTTGLSGFVESVHVMRSQRCLCGAPCARVGRVTSRRVALRRVAAQRDRDAWIRAEWPVSIWPYLRSKEVSSTGRVVSRRGSGSLQLLDLSMCGSCAPCRACRRDSPSAVVGHAGAV